MSAPSSAPATASATATASPAQPPVEHKKVLHPSKQNEAAEASAAAAAAAASGAAGNNTGRSPRGPHSSPNGGRSPRKVLGQEMDAPSALVMPVASSLAVPSVGPAGAAIDLKQAPASVATAAGAATIVTPAPAPTGAVLSPSVTTTLRTDANRPAQELSNAGLQRFLRAHTVDALAAQGKIIELDATIEPLKGFEELFKHNILSAPVYDSERKEYAGFLDVRDMVSALVFANEKHPSAAASHLLAAPGANTNGGGGASAAAGSGGAATGAASPLLSPDWNEALPLVMGMKAEADRRGSGAGKLGAGMSPGHSHYKQPAASDVVISTTYLARRNPFHAVKAGANLIDVVDILAKGHHRVPVLGADGRCVRIVSQSSLIAFLADAIASGKDADLVSDLSQTLGDMGLAHKRTVCVPSKTLALDAFKVLDKYHISGLAIVGLNEALLAHTSGADLKLFVLDKGRLSLNVPILEYLKAIRAHRASPVDIAFPTVIATPHDTVAKTIQKLAATKQHRIFVVEDTIKKKVCGVVALTDILRFVQHTPQQLSQIQSDITTHGRVTTPSLVHVIERSTPLPSPKASPRPSPRASPHSSPRGSPRSSKRRLSLGREAVGFGSLDTTGPIGSGGSGSAGAAGSALPAAGGSPSHSNSAKDAAGAGDNKRGSKEKMAFNKLMAAATAAGLGLGGSGGGAGAAGSGGSGGGLGGALKSMLTPIDVPSTIVEPMTPVVEDAPARPSGGGLGKTKMHRSTSSASHPPVSPPPPTK